MSLSENGEYDKLAQQWMKLNSTFRMFFGGDCCNYPPILVAPLFKQLQFPWYILESQELGSDGSDRPAQLLDGFNEVKTL